MTLSRRSIRRTSTRGMLCFAASYRALVPLGFCKDAQECRIGVRHPMAEGESANEDGDSGEQAVEEVECAHRADADEVEQRPLDAQVREGLVQALVDPVPPPGCCVCLHRMPLTLEEVESVAVAALGWSTFRCPKASSGR